MSYPVNDSSGSCLWDVLLHADTLSLVVVVSVYQSQKENSGLRYWSVVVSVYQSQKETSGLRYWSDFAVAVAQRLGIPQAFSSGLVPISGQNASPSLQRRGALASPHSVCTLFIKTLYVQIICNSVKICHWTSLGSPGSHDWLGHDKMVKAFHGRAGQTLFWVLPRAVSVWPGDGDQPWATPSPSPPDAVLDWTRRSRWWTAITVMFAES